MEDLNINSSTNTFLKKLKLLIRENFLNEQFGVETLAEMCGLSRAHLYKKIKRFTGKSASQFIREVRLEEAMKLLISQNYSVSEVAHHVGFSSTSYFTVCFKEYYGYSPSDVKKRHVETLDEFPPFNRKKPKLNSRKWIVISCVVILVLGAFVWASNTFDKTEIIKDKTIAVIRFDDMTNDQNHQIFADGLGQEIINSLCKIRAIKVTARNSSFQFNKKDDVTRISKVLNVNYVVEGSVRKENDLYRITVQLIDAKDGYHMWSQNFDRKSEDLLLLQEEIARIIANKLHIELSKDEDQSLANRITLDSMAYAYFNESLKVEQIGIGSEERDKSLDLMKLAIETDSNFAMAHARIVGLYKWSSYVGDTPLNVAISAMKYHAEKAIKLDPNLPESYIAKGQLEVVQNNYKEALESYGRAIELAPNHALANFEIAYPLRYLNRTREGYEAWLKAFEIDPLNPGVSIMVAQYYYFIKMDFDKGKTILKNYIDAFPNKGFHAYHLEMYRLSIPEGNGANAFKNLYNIYKNNPDGPGPIGWLIWTSMTLDLKPVSDMLTDKLRLLYPNRVPTFWHLYNNNAINGKHQENLELVKYWAENLKLNDFQFANFMADSYINNGKPNLAKEIIEDSIENLFESDFLSNAENFDPYLINRLDLLEKYIIALRELGLTDEANKFSAQVVDYIDGEIIRLERQEILDYRRAFDLKLVRASVNDDVDECLKFLNKTYFVDNHFSELFFRQPKSFSRFYRFKRLPEFQIFQDKLRRKIHEQRDEVISFLKEEGVWQENWNWRL